MSNLILIQKRVSVHFDDNASVHGVDSFESQVHFRTSVTGIMNRIQLIDFRVLVEQLE